MGLLLQSAAFVCNHVASAEVLPPAQNALARKSSILLGVSDKAGKKTNSVSSLE